MRYTNGNYEAFVRPAKNAGVEKKTAHIVGSGLAGLAAAVFLIRDGYMPAKNIHIYEELDEAGGSLDGHFISNVGLVTRGGREMENHFETLWDLYRSIPSLEVPDASVLDEFYRLNSEDPNSSNCRMIAKRGERVPDDGKFTLSRQAQKELMDLFMRSEDQLIGEKIEDVFSDEFFASNFWLYWSTMFAFEKWHSAIEMRRYIHRFIHHIEGLPDFTALKFTKYNQYESLVKPVLAYLKDAGVNFHYSTEVNNVLVEENNAQLTAKQLILTENGQSKQINLTGDDLVFVTNGSITESSTQGDQHTPAPITHEAGGSWRLWENLAAQSPKFGHPSVFYKNLPAESWFVSATVTFKDDQIDPYIKRLTQRDLRTGKVVTGGIVTIKDSNWLMSFAIHRQPHFKEQKSGETVMWVYGLLSNKPGNYIKKPIEQASGEEIVEELMYHLGMPEAEIHTFAENAVNAVPVYMPFITSYFMLRQPGDRPAVVPDGVQNLAFIGNFAESAQPDTVFTTEYSVRTAMEAVYTLLKVDRGVPEVFDSAYDVRELAKAMYYLSDKKQIAEMDLPFIEKQAIEHVLKKYRGTYLEEIARGANLL
ncbi:oxidoreductase [Weissella oryzae SG25]|uniref:Oxidoreductase n=1 Tax=Weissella oryzae (strain DSM 25784 / JCM 18191 / LMG 30913 / SG25) TaxID=1329250 RepID=A0A069CSJ2_WEIOS|nr:oleate hydratase [Weissella oryzae]GAK30352.1 oxidoreductase [Weissella oryzae SG25]